MPGLLSMSSISYLQKNANNRTNRLGNENDRMGAPYGREQTTELATEAGRYVNQALGRPSEILHGHDIL
jgi:hypothetical protein